MMRRVVFTLAHLAIGTSAVLAQSVEWRTNAPRELSTAEARDSISSCLRSINTTKAGDRMRSIEIALQAWSLARSHAPDLSQDCQIRLAHVYLEQGLPTKALEHAGSVLSIDPNANEALLVKAEALTASAHYPEAEQAWSDLLAAANDDPQMGAHALKGLLRCAVALGDRDKAIGFGERLLTMYWTNDDRTNAGILFNELGQLQSAQGRHDEALRCYTEAMTYVKGSSAHWLVAASNRAAELVRLDRIPQALLELEQVRMRATVDGALGMADRARLLRSAALLLEGHHADALEEARTAQSAAQTRGDTLVHMEACELLAHICAAFGQHVRADSYAAQAADIRASLQNKQRLAAEARTALFAQAQRYETQLMERSEEQHRERKRLQRLEREAADFAQKLDLERVEGDMRSAELQRAVEQAEAEKRLALARNDLRAEQQRRIIQELEVGRTTQALELARREQEQQAQQKNVDRLISDRALQTAEIARNQAEHRSSIWVMTCLAIVILGGIVALLAMRRKNRLINRQVEQIAEINTQLSDRHSDMLSSIRAAEKIQRAIIPSMDELRSILPDSFVFYQPLDIVSGDLPFVRSHEGRLFLATVDCTGHGVPAAMLSFMAYYNLNDIISARKDLDVGGILTLLHERIRAQVHGHANEQEMGDGMDITLVELDLERRTMWYSGAQNSLLFVRDGVCHRVMGDKCSIGDGHPACNNGFRSHQIDLRPSDRVYLYSDGLVHQFGGKGRSKKLGHAQLMHSIESFADRSAEATGKDLAHLYKTWKGNLPQTDDIVLIGFSIDGLASVMAA